MAAAKFTFLRRALERSRLLAVVARVVIITALLHLAIGIWAGYRAWVQVRALDLRAETQILRPGMPALVHVVTSGRTFVTVKLELFQGARTATLADLRVAPSRHAFYDPRERQGTMTPSFTGEFLAQFQPGPAVLRATAAGEPQMLRTPPPVVKEIAVVVALP